MNTLANHGYIPHNGIASFEQITNALMEAFNLELVFAANIAANNMVRPNYKNNHFKSSEDGIFS